MAIVRDSITFAQDVTFSGSCTFAETPAEIVITSLTGLQLGADGAGTAAPALTFKKTAAGTADVIFEAADNLRGRIRCDSAEAIIIETFDASSVSTGTVTMSNAAGAVALSGALAVTGATTMAAAACTTLAASGAVTCATTLGVTGASTMAAVGCTTLAASGAVTCATTLGITGTTTAAAVNSTALAASTSLTVTGATVVGLHEHVTVDIVTLAGAGGTVYGFASPVAGTITKIQSWLKGAITTADAVITGKIGAVAITNGVVTIAQVDSAQGDVDVANPTAANTVAVGSNVNFTVSGTQDAVIGATLTVSILRSA